MRFGVLILVAIELNFTLQMVYLLLELVNSFEQSRNLFILLLKLLLSFSECGSDVHYMLFVVWTSLSAFSRLSNEGL